MKKTFNQVHNFINDKDCYTKNILAKLYLYKHKIVSTTKKFVIMENQTSVSKLKRKKIPYIKLKKSLIGFNLTLDYYIFKHKRNSLFSFELPFIEKNINRKKTDFNSVCYKLYAMNSFGLKHLMVLIRPIKGGFLALSGNICGFIPRSAAIRLEMRNKKKNVLKKRRESFLKQSKYFLQWHKIQMGKFTIKTRLRIKNFERKRRMSRSKMFLKNISFVFLSKMRELRHLAKPERVSNTKKRLLINEVSKILKFNKHIRYRSSPKRIRRIILKHKNHALKREAMRLCVKFIKGSNGKKIKKKKKITKFKNIRSRKRNKCFLRFLFR